MADLDRLHSEAALVPAVLPAGQSFGKMRWVVIFCTFIVAAVSYLDRNNISIAASSVQKEFGLTDVQLGGVFSAFIMGYAFTQPLAGRIADRFGASRVIATAIVWWSVFTSLLPAIPVGIPGAVAILLGVRFLLGVGEAVIFPASNRLVASWIPSRERGLANGLIFAGVGVGGGVAPPLITFIMLNHSWRWAFWLCALFGIAAGAMWLLLVRNSPAEQPSVSAAELAYIKAGLPIHTATAERPARWQDVVLDRQVAVLTLSYFCYGYVAYIFFTWFFKYLSDVRGLNLKASALYATLPFVAMALASSLGGLASDKLLGVIGKRAARCGIAGASLAAASIFVWLATQVADARVAALVLAGGAGALYFAQSAFWAISADIGGPSAGLVSGIMNMGCQLGGVVTAALTPVIANSFGWTASFAAAALVCLVGAVAWIFVDPFHALAPRSQ
ncbi:MAG: major facilitator superfamily 1 [Gammaproteobacteria bacterium]|nr:major facilitator superfamily 1 [Gammaproteobacteria bacterium]